MPIEAFRATGKWAQSVDLTALEVWNREEPSAAFSRDELNAKLQVIETHMEGHLAGMEMIVKSLEKNVDTGRAENANHRMLIIGGVIGTGIVVIGAIRLLLGGLAAGQQAAVTTAAPPPQIIYIQPPPIGAQPEGAFRPQIEQQSPKEQSPP